LKTINDSLTHGTIVTYVALVFVFKLKN